MRSGYGVYLIIYILRKEADMATKYEDVKRNERLLISLTGLTRPEFEKLLPVFGRVCPHMHQAKP